MNHFQFRVAIGTIGVTWNSLGQISRLDWYENSLRELTTDIVPLASTTPPSIARIVDQLRGYFLHGEPITQIDWDWIDSRHWSEFQARVYKALLSIPHGETRTYSWVATRIGRIGKIAAPRAVGQALRRNPLPVIIPCHRIVGTDAIGGFMGITDPDRAELKLKTWLIDHEASYRSPLFSFAEPTIGAMG